MIFQTKNLTKKYPGTDFFALDKLNLEVKEGEIFGFIGPNGAGKSTTIRLLLDLIRPTLGHAQIFGLDANKCSKKIKENIGYLPGEIFLNENSTGKQLVKYYSGFKQKVNESYLNKLIKTFDLDLSKKAKEYSKGNKQKLAIVLAFMHQPKFLILDEPTSGLDPLNQQHFYDTVLEARNSGATVFFSTHLLFEAEKVCDRVGIIKLGKLLAIEDIDKFREKNLQEIHIETQAEIRDLNCPNITKIKKTVDGYKIMASGQNGNVIKALSIYDISNFKITEPSLEDLFMHYYKD